MNPNIDPDIEHLARNVIGAGIEVHRALGAGFLESVYEEALCVELGLRRIRYERQHPIQVMYKGYPVGQGRIDVFVDSRLIVELKAVETLLPIHIAQTLSYLKAAKLPLGLLMNFNVDVLKRGIQRVILT